LNLLIRDYSYLIKNPTELSIKLSYLKEIHGHQVLDHWSALIEAQAWPELINDLLVRHYDKLYERSQEKNFTHFTSAPRIHVNSLSPSSIKSIAKEIQERFSSSLSD
jgi:tRNA 2-selenouridine synthase